MFIPQQIKVKFYLTDDESPEVSTVEGKELIRHGEIRVNESTQQWKGSLE